MRSNLNILTSDLGPSQMNYFLIRNVNHFHGNHLDKNIQVFTENLSRFCLKPHFGVMNVSEAWGQGGPFISTNISTTSKLVTYPLTSKKFFYIWDLEWLRPQYRIYDMYSPFYLDKGIELISRSKEHKDLIENAFNREVKHIVENFDLDKLNEIIK